MKYFFILFTFFTLSLYGQEDAAESDTSSHALILVERKALFDPSCALLDDNAEQNRCSNRLFVSYVAGNLSYPEEAEDRQIDGVVYVQFVVNDDGSIGYVDMV